MIDLDRGGLGYDQEEISPDGTVGGSACFASKWLDYFDPLVTEKITETGLDMVETDGPCQFARALTRDVVAQSCELAERFVSG